MRNCVLELVVERKEQLLFGTSRSRICSLCEKGCARVHHGRAHSVRVGRGLGIFSYIHGKIYASTQVRSGTPSLAGRCHTHPPPLQLVHE
jgi:hypothetical protein